jgi:hypothetical protein
VKIGFGNSEIGFGNSEIGFGNSEIGFGNSFEHGTLTEKAYRQRPILPHAPVAPIVLHAPV